MPCQPRCFSLKYQPEINLLLSTMSQRRLNATAVCAAYPDEVESADVAQLARVFISQKPVRGQRFMV